MCKFTLIPSIHAARRAGVTLDVTPKDKSTLIIESLTLYDACVSSTHT